MKHIILAATLLAVTSTAFADDYTIKRRPSGRYDVRDSYGNSVGSIRRSPSGRLRLQTYDDYYTPRRSYQQPKYNYYYSTPYPSANPGYYYQYDSSGNYQWQYNW
jgi:hypothetical protein